MKPIASQIASILSCSALALSLSSCQTATRSAGALLNAPGKIINGVLKGPVIPYIPTNFGENANPIDDGMASPLDSPPLLSGDEESMALVQSTDTGA
jgi:hypothetical protein